METVNYKENPALFISFLKAFAGHNIHTRREKISFNYKKIIREEYRFNGIKKFILFSLIKQSIKRVRDRENFRFMRTVSFGLVRRIYRAIDNELLREKLILEKGDSLYLLMDEIMDRDKKLNYQPLIRKRKETYQNYKRVEEYNRYIQTGENLKPDITSEASSDSKIIKGVGCSTGIVRAEVKLVEATTTSEGCFGKILISNFFEPGKLNLFSRSAGLISVRGNLLSHTAILCREMGIPAIVSAKGLLQQVKDGDIIEMDGATGIIKLTVNE